MKKRLAKHWDEYQVNYILTAYAIGVHTMFYIFFGVL